MLLVEDTLIIIRRVDAVALLLETSEIPISDLLVIAACNGVGHGVSLVEHRAAYARNKNLFAGVARLVGRFH